MADTCKYLIRNAKKTDLEAIKHLFNSPDNKFIGNIRIALDNIDGLLKRYQSHCLIAFNEQSKLVGYAEFCQFPAIQALPPDCWLYWIRHNFCIDLPVSYLNTQFLNFCIYQKMESFAVIELLKGAFFRENKVSYIITVKQPQLPTHEYYLEDYEVIEEYAMKYYAKDYTINCTNLQQLLIISRKRILPIFTYRKALAEDNDDIIEVHDLERPDLREDQGDYYIAEELLRRDENAHKTFIIVAEVLNESKESSITGFIWLSTDIDIIDLVKNYDLENFGYLVKFKEEAPYKSVTLYSNIWRVKSNISLFTEEAVSDWRDNTIMGGLQKYGSGMSVASISKVRVRSVFGVLETNKEQQYYERESLFAKFKCIYEQFRNPTHYGTNEYNLINFRFNTYTEDQLDPNENGNVFELKYCGLCSEHSVGHLFVFLMVGFSAYPERDYCIIQVPKSEPLAPSMKHMLKYLIPVQQQSNISGIISELFITHRSAIYGELSLHEIVESDVEEIEEMLSLYHDTLDSVDSTITYQSKMYREAEVHCEAEILDNIIRDVLRMEHSDFKVFTIKCGTSATNSDDSTFVGFVILSPFKNHHLLYHHYIMPKNDYHYDHQRAEVIMLKLHPLFHVWTDELFRSMAFKTGYFEFYYINNLRDLTLSNDLTNNMMPIEPKRRKTLWYHKAGHRPAFEHEKHLQMPKRDYFYDHLAAYCHKLHPSLLFGGKQRIVIIGFSSVARAFIRLMAFQWNSKDQQNTGSFTCLSNLSITVIASAGSVEAEYESKFRCPYCPSMHNCYIGNENYSDFVRDTIARMDLRKWVHFIPQGVAFIDRQNKFVKLANECEIYYDTLLLMPKYSFCHGEKEIYGKNYLPLNFLQISSRLDKFRLYYQTKLLREELPNFQIIIYGSCLGTYDCINFLINHGTCAGNITLALPHLGTGCANDMKIKNPNIDINVQYILEEMVSDLGVTIKDGLSLSKFNLYTNQKYISDVEFRCYPSGKELNLPCDLFINFVCDGLHPRNTKLFQKSGIELSNGMILVNENYRTNDPYIYAMGLHIKMSKEINYQYQYTSEKEAAEKLIRILKLYPTSDKDPYDPRYSQPALFQAQLPLGFYLTKLTLPVRFLRNYIVSEQNCGMTTYYQGDFCRIRVNQHNIVEEMLIITRTFHSRKMGYMEHFCGKHESLLNKLKERFKGGQIKCFLHFFQEPWTELIMHDSFEDLQAENMRMLKPLASVALKNIQNNGSRDLDTQEFYDINKVFVEHSLYDFLRKYRKDFVNEFAIPEDLRYKMSERH